VLAGPLGKYEDEAHANGTKRVLQAVANSEAFKIAAGGDTAEALASFGFEGSFDWTAIGGGATLEFLAKGTLPGIEAVVGQLPV
jgi:3-phosphoglycerate kinase